jgi:hypothetical protein
MKELRGTPWHAHRRNSQADLPRLVAGERLDLRPRSAHSSSSRRAASAPEPRCWYRDGEDGSSNDDAGHSEGKPEKEIDGVRRVWFTVLALSLGALAALLGVFAWYFTEKVSNAKDAEIARFQAESNLKLEAVRQQQAPRNLSTERLGFLTGALSRGQKAEVHIQRLSDPEAFPFAQELEAALRSAGWTVNPSIVEITQAHPPLVGLQIGVFDKAAPSASAIALKAALSAGGFESAYVDPYGPDDGRVILIVGAKP